jgi:hypothetical protein
MSACVPLDRLLQTVKVTAPGVTDAMLNIVVFNTIDEFLRRTNAWKETDDITLAENIQQYDLHVPVDAVVVRMISVMHNNIPVPAYGTAGTVSSSVGMLSPELVFPDGDAEFAFSESDMGPGNVFSYAVYRPDFIAVTTPPDEGQRKYPLQVVMALSIAKECLEADCGDWALPEWMYEMYFGDWLDGVLSKLYAMPAKPWTNKELVSYHGRRFRNAMAFRKQEAKRGFVYNKPMWRFPRSGM